MAAIPKPSGPAGGWPLLIVWAGIEIGKIIWEEVRRRRVEAEAS